MTWQVKPTITVAGVEYTNLTFNQVSIDYGRSKIFDTPRPGYARVEIANLTNTAFPFKVNDSLVIELENASAADITVFTGIVTDVKGSFRNSDASSGLGIITLTAVAPMAQMSRIVVGQSAYPAESDADRISRIFTEAGITVDVVDPAIYNFVARPASLTDAFSLSNNYANSVLGAIYETTDGKVGYANESRRLVEVNTNGYVSIPNSSIIINSISSHENIADVMNLANVTYSGGTVSDFDTGSQSTYGLIGATFNTEISNALDAETIAATYINLRSIPRKNLSTFQVRLYDPTLTTAQVNDLLGVYFGMPVTVPGLPNAIVDADYYGYVEGWNLSFSPAAAVVTLKTSEEAYSYRDMRWQDVDPTVQWEDVEPSVTTSTKTNLVPNPSFEPIDYGKLGYIYLPGIGNYFLSSPDEAALDITGDIDIRCKVALDDWTPGSNVTLLAKEQTTTTRSYRLSVGGSGTLIFAWSANGSTALSATSTIITGIADGSTKWIRATIDVDNGAGGRDIKFYISDDGTLWTQLGATVTQAGTTSIYSGTSQLEFATRLAGSTEPAKGKFYAASIRDGIDGTEVFHFDVGGNWQPTDIDSFTAQTGQTVSLSNLMRITGQNTVGTVNRQSSEKYIGAIGLKWTATSASASLAISTLGAKRIACASGDTIYWQFRAKAGSGSRTVTPQIRTYANTTTNTITEQFIGTAVTLDSTWKLIQQTATVTNASSLFFTYWVNAAAGSIGDFFYLDALIVEKNAGGFAAFYFDGSYSEIPADRDPKLAWTGEPNDSTSTAIAYWGTKPTTLWNNVDEQGIP